MSAWSGHRRGFKHYLVEQVREKTGLSYRKSQEAVDLTLKCMVDALVEGQEVCFDGFTLQAVRHPTRRMYRLGRVMVINKTYFQVTPTG